MNTKVTNLLAQQAVALRTIVSDLEAVEANLALAAEGKSEDELDGFSDCEEQIAAWLGQLAKAALLSPRSIAVNRALHSAALCLRTGEWKRQAKKEIR